MQTNANANSLVPNRVVVQVLALAAIVMFLLAHEMYYDYLTDDAFISLRYVRNFIEGHGLVYNIGERVEGYTNFLWVLLLAGLGIAGADIVLAARVGGVAFSVVTLVLVYRFSEVHYLERGYVKLVAPALLACSVPYAVWALSGMETQFFTFLVFVAVFRLVHEVQTSPRYPLSAVLFAIAALARPEGVLFFAASLLALSIHNVRRQHRIVSGHLIAMILAFALAYVPYFLWRWNYYGWFLPNTFYAKVGGDYFRYLRGAYYTVKFVRTFGGLLALALPIVIFLRKDLKFNVLSHIVIVLVFLVYIIYVGGDGLVASRFFVPVLPSICLLVQSGLSTLITALSTSYGARPAISAGVILVLAVLGATLEPSYNIRRDPYLQVIEAREYSRNLARIGHWFRENASPADTIAVNAAGIVPYYSGLYATDMLGLVDEHIAHVHVPDMGHGQAGHEKGDLAYVLSRRPTWIFDGWLTQNQQSRPPLVVDDDTTYMFRSIKVGRGRFLERVELKEGDLWLNFYELRQTTTESDHPNLSETQHRS